MEEGRIDTVQKSWNEWELRASLLFSLLFQIILILSGNLRKRSSHKRITVLLWLTYLSADWVATFALGIISKTLGDSSPFYANDILALWTPFLLLHLGGPDTITAFSLEDNQLWLRHAFALIIQFIAVIYIFARSMHGSKLIFPTLLIFLAGILKYGERTWALKQASMDGLRGLLIKEPDPGPDYSQLMCGFASKFNAGIPAKLDVHKEFEISKVSSSSPLLEMGTSNNHRYNLQILSQSYTFFKIFRRLFVDLILSFKEQHDSRSIFINCDPSLAFKVIEIELNFAYDILYTKALVVHTLCGRIFRAVSFSSTLVAFFFFLLIEKKDYHRIDIGITYLLLVGAVVLEIVALGLLVFSDWTIVMLRNSKHYEKLKWLERMTYQIIGIFRREHQWSNCIGQYSLLSHCIHNHQPTTCFDKLLMKIKDMWDEYFCGKHVEMFKELKYFIFEDLEKKSAFMENSEQYRGLSNCRGQLALEQNDCSTFGWSIEVGFDESLLLWHIATEICFHLDNFRTERPDDEHRTMSIALSRYLLYLLVRRPLTLSSTAGLGTIRYGDTCAETMGFFKTESIFGDEFEACKLLMNAHTYIPVKDVKGDRSKSVLWDAVRLAKELLALGEEKMWMVVCEVWIEMLSFAARHCKGNYHAQMLSVGGELVTFVWFLEAHLGMGEQYQIKSGQFTTNVVLDR